ncbi:MAG: exodeoxyribonuclease VII small subunit [Planctomycetaceae bacterium]|jgi:exodeoxyribonuclease VII small subunit|nr:exodeoxyribonuclease VII small subunit [Planctomycetaceae bacterium]MBT6154682.1 exodeoxyribonuclease VII small subunit [Planctomycetaceae bacterium]MBT6484758.1 exodeoxyribonuclease VII small subunit [Planctomycetaceae bacterium]MBT6494144.1 exodeoxyribonuclease VII small subunit [Planctomycetaceae bacterium]
MAKAKDKQPGADETSPEPSFEQALTELQQIVDDLEAGQIGLDESMQRFEQGIALLRNCYGTLEKAEQKIEILTGTDEAGRPLTEPFDATSTVQQKKTSAGRRKRTTTKKATDKAETVQDEESDPRKRLF